MSTSVRSECARAGLECELGKNNLQHLGAQPCLDASATCSAVGPPGARVGTVPLSLALPAFVTADGNFDFAGFRGAVKQAVLVGDRLNNLVCQVNQSATQHARDARPVCLGVHGLADAFILLEIPFTSGEARTATLEIFETFYNATLNASCELAEGDGPCSTWTGSLGEQGRHYVNMWPVDMNPDQGFDVLRQLISRHGLRNCMLACMPPMQWFPAMHADGEAMEFHTTTPQTLSLALSFKYFDGGSEHCTCLAWEGRLNLEGLLFTSEISTLIHVEVIASEFAELMIHCIKVHRPAAHQPRHRASEDALSPSPAPPLER